MGHKTAIATDLMNEHETGRWLLKRKLGGLPVLPPRRNKSSLPCHPAQSEPKPQRNQ